MKHISAGVNTDRIHIFRSAFHGLKMAQHASYCLKSSRTLQGWCWHRENRFGLIYVMIYVHLNGVHSQHLPAPLSAPCPLFSYFFKIMQWVEVSSKLGVNLHFNFFLCTHWAHFLPVRAASLESYATFGLYWPPGNSSTICASNDCWWVTCFFCLRVLTSQAWLIIAKPSFSNLWRLFKEICYLNHTGSQACVECSVNITCFSELFHQVFFFLKGCLFGLEDAAGRLL